MEKSRKIYMVVWGFYGRGPLDDKATQINEDQYKFFHFPAEVSRKEVEQQIRSSSERFITPNDLGEVVSKGSLMDMKISPSSTYAEIHHVMEVKVSEQSNPKVY